MQNPASNDANSRHRGIASPMSALDKAGRSHAAGGNDTQAWNA
jgi:hypothetical protein